MLQPGFARQMPCLDKLWPGERLRTTRQNPSGAYGIPQALPGSKMATFGADWQTNPVTQIKWGLDYIKGRYKTPCGAWAHSQATAGTESDDIAPVVRGGRARNLLPVDLTWGDVAQPEPGRGRRGSAPTRSTPRWAGRSWPCARWCRCCS